jgi:dissimilatory sulfite reductase (desulfoviridin) alpha/beta subunit
VATSPRKFGYDDAMVTILVARLSDNLNPDLDSPQISSSVVSLTQSNMREQVITELMKRIGFTDFWKEIGKQTDIKIFLEATSDTEAAKQAG